MANRLAMLKSQGIQSLAAAGHSERAIAEALGVSRGAVRRHLGREGSKRTKAPTGEAPTGSEGPNGTKAPTGSEAGFEAGLGESRSLCVGLRDQILAKLEQGLTAERIYQDLKAEHGFGGKYSSVRRYVHRLRTRRELPYRRIETAPGYELQVDYGTGAGCRDAEGKRIKTHVFRLVMSYSRKAYSEAVRRLTTESFLRSLENAFWALGGVPHLVVFDNAKSAVKKADWYDPELNPQLVEFCKHYGIAFQPTRPRTPRHKGKVERSVGYVKGNSLQAREFESLAAQNAHLREWERTVADTRIHGTTKRHVGQVFENEERPALRPLPAERFPIFKEGQRRVSRDGHVEVARAYYSVPPEYRCQRAPKFNGVWNKEAVYRYFSGSPNFWSKEDIDHNVLQKYSPKGMLFTKFDPKSIMLYDFDAALFTDGLGSTNSNKKLSPTDISFIKSLYP